MKLSPLLQALTATLLLVATSCMQLQPGITSPQPAVTSAAFKAKLEQVGKAQFTAGNTVNTYVNGREYFPPMLADIAAAKHSITFETFIFMHGRISTKFAKALAERAKAGVEVKVLLDWIGSLEIARSDIKIMRDGGVDLHFYRSLSSNPFKMNNRTHRKIMVVDGKVAWTGGAGFADAWNHNAQNKWYWRDTQYRLTGPAVTKVQEVFMNNWREATKQDLLGDTYFPKNKPTGNISVQTVLGAPKEQGDTIGSCYLLAVHAAKKSILIENPYVVLPKELENALLDARKRGVNVTLLTPGKHIDMPLTRKAAHGFWPKLMAAGGEVYEYQPTMVHSKVMVVDDFLVLAGSSNLDNRSFFINDEINIHILDKSIAARETRHIRNDIKKAKLLKPHQCKASWLAWLLKCQL